MILFGSLRANAGPNATMAHGGRGINGMNGTAPAISLNPCVRLYASWPICPNAVQSSPPLLAALVKTIENTRNSLYSHFGITFAY